MKSTHTITKQFDNLVYLDDYIDTIEAVPLDLQRNFTLMRELDGYAQELMSTVSKNAIELIDNIKDMEPNTRLDRLKDLTKILTETLKRGEEKVALAKSTFDAVDRHCNRLDADLVKFEEDQIVGDSRITTLPGLQPSARSLKEGVDVRDRATKRLLDRERKELKGEKKKRKTAKDTNTGSGSTPPPLARAQTLEKSKSSKSIEKEKMKYTYNKNGNGKPKTVVPVDLPIDPNEPLYCYCQQVSYGEMVACDNTDVL
ncbi:Inhibitor of growth protein 4 [Choanephora cucurbitarum]|uniref:Inhibitor of growth protein 4 n=1 Tax=Choanephora cucurbitarum TaxID=101091 RepID=A0A1C7NA89_9FUNG|nr:Inhibitor of growth protein 4 [Choanephora cucurbitarum]